MAVADVAGESGGGIPPRCCRHVWPSHWSPAVLGGMSVGLLGALTTFSTLAGELWGQQENGDWGALALYGASSIFGGLLAAIGGLRVGRSLR